MEELTPVKKIKSYSDKGSLKSMPGTFRAVDRISYTPALNQHRLKEAPIKEEQRDFGPTKKQPLFPFNQAVNQDRQTSKAEQVTTATIKQIIWFLVICPPE